MSLDQNDNTICTDGQSFGINSNKYNISNFFKHIYSLKSINVPFQSSSNYNQSSNSLKNSENNQNTNGSKQFWMPDEQVKECFQCSQKFTTIRRRHVVFFRFLKKFNNLILFSIVEYVVKYFALNAPNMKYQARLFGRTQMVILELVRFVTRLWPKYKLLVTLILDKIQRQSKN